MEREWEEVETPLAQVEELAELKRRYEIYDSATLFRWVTAVTGAHRQAIAAVLRDRGNRREESQR